LIDNIPKAMLEPCAVGFSLLGFVGNAVVGSDEKPG
jgi:hypothetical protein